MGRADRRVFASVVSELVPLHSPDAHNGSRCERRDVTSGRRVSWPAVSVAFVEGSGRVGQDAEQQPGRIPHHLPGVHALDAPGAEVLEPGCFGVQVVGVDIQVDAGGSLVQALGQQPEVLAVQRGAAVLGMVVEWRQRLGEGCLPEGHLAVVVTCGYVDDDLEQPAEVRHGTKVRG
jgi:hypothetical protein